MNNLELVQSLSSYKSIERDFENGNVTHAYMLRCDDKELSFSFAQLLAANILCKEKKACLKCRLCQNTLKLLHPDLFVYPQKGERVLSDDIASIIDSSMLAGMEGGNKVYILKNVSSMQEVAQNKLLKVLEEPPKGVYFILLCESEDAVLLTVKSRVTQIEVEKLPFKAILDRLLKDSDDKEKAAAAAYSCGGNLSKAISMMSDENYIAMYDDMFAFLADFTHSGKLLEKSGVLLRYDLKDSLPLIMQALSDALLYRAKPELIANRGKINEIKQIVSNYPQSAIIAAIELVDIAKNKLVYNCNKLQVIDSLLIGILEERNKCLI